MSNRVIGCKTAKEIWDALEIRCQGTKGIKNNRRTILTQEYEHFDSKAGESLTDLYDRFVKLLNDLSLVDKEYDLEDSNLKFLLALPEKWDLKVTTIRDNHNLEEMSLDDIFGRLKTYEVEMEQRSKRHGGKPKSVALKVQGEAAVKNKGKTHVTKSDTESSNSDDDSDSDVLSDSEDSDTEMMQLAALMVKSFKKMAYKNFNKGKKFLRNDRNSDKKGFKKNEGKEEISGKADKSKYTCFNYGEKGHFATECNKAKNEKEQAFITKKGSWVKSFKKMAYKNFNKGKKFLRNDRNSDKKGFKKNEGKEEISGKADKSKYTCFNYGEKGHFATECNKAKNEKEQAFITKKGSWADSSDSKEEVNYALMKELVHMLVVQKERDDSVFIKDELLKKNASIESELAKEKEIIKTWTNSGKTTQNILDSGNWKKGLGYIDKNEAEPFQQETVKIDRPKVAPVRFVAESEVHVKSKTDKPKQVNIGLMTQKQLKHKLKEVKQENRIKEPRKNRNGKEE
ncbi:uncharacterized protein LOC135152054 [Daucus carota subsp. sativus]|uniref:uncharacterized protein LOC135152054 n=1 Tax=Daucus carota subsp. sativus TaxID=79200 RepID=UPI003083768A